MSTTEAELAKVSKNPNGAANKKFEKNAAKAERLAGLAHVDAGERWLYEQQEAVEAAERGQAMEAYKTLTAYFEKEKTTRNQKHDQAFDAFIKGIGSGSKFALILVPVFMLLYQAYHLHEQGKVQEAYDKMDLARQYLYEMYERPELTKEAMAKMKDTPKARLKEMQALVDDVKARRDAWRAQKRQKEQQEKMAAAPQLEPGEQIVPRDVQMMPSGPLPTGRVNPRDVREMPVTPEYAPSARPAEPTAPFAGTQPANAQPDFSSVRETQTPFSATMHEQPAAPHAVTEQPEPPATPPGSAPPTSGPSPSGV